MICFVRIICMKEDGSEIDLDVPIRAKDERQACLKAAKIDIADYLHLSVDDGSVRPYRYEVVLRLAETAKEEKQLALCPSLHQEDIVYTLNGHQLPWLCLRHNDANEAEVDTEHLMELLARRMCCTTILEPGCKRETKRNQIQNHNPKQ